MINNLKSDLKLNIDEISKNVEITSNDVNNYITKINNFDQEIEIHINKINECEIK